MKLIPHQRIPGQEVEVEEIGSSSNERDLIERRKKVLTFHLKAKNQKKKTTTTDQVTIRTITCKITEILIWQTQQPEMRRT